MRGGRVLTAGLGTAIATGGVVLVVSALAGQEPRPGGPAADAIAEAQTPRRVTIDRPDQKKTDHDRSDIFSRRPPSARW
jgi:hypothetical protein